LWHTQYCGVLCSKVLETSSRFLGIKFYLKKNVLIYPITKQKESRLRHTSLCRLIFSIILLNILPFGSLLLVLNSLSAYNDVIISLKNFPIFFYLLFSSLSVFGYYRFYRVLTKCEWAKWLFCDELDIIASEGPEEGDYKGHLIGVVFYWGVPVVMWFILTFY